MLINIPQVSQPARFCDRLNQQDQTLILSGMIWDDFEQLISEAYSGYRISYFGGEITIVSPGRNHERIAETINYLIIAYCREYQILYYPFRSTTLKNPPLAGKEPDVSFAFNQDKYLPDLAVEVVFSSGEVADLQKYRVLGIPEVWFWQNNIITFYQLENDNYQVIKKSQYLSNLESSNLINFINRGLTESPLTIEAEFIKQFK
ncbi:MAG TPA: Uma2 family endonuclease [Xenococcaceae cyanobacterium]|jgi:Uma2 family endonuclease